MLQIAQESFARLMEDGFVDEALVIHHRPQRRGQCLTLLLHGLTGRRYEYWGDMPSFLFTDFPHSDLGLYQYATGLQRIRGFWKSIDLEDEARVLADILRRLDYTSIILIGHSMGGLLAKGAIAQLLAMNERRTLRRITGLVLLASPQAGSLRVPRVLKLLSRDARSLSPHNQYIQRTDTLLRSNINTDARARPDKPQNIPTWAVVAAHDFWVDAMSAGLHLPNVQQLFVRGNHGSIIRPAHREADTYKFVRECITTACKPETHKGRHIDEIVCEPAEPRDAEGIHSLAAELFGEGVSSVQSILEFITSNRAICRVVRRVRYTDYSRWETMVGYYAIVALTKDAAEKIKARQISGGELGGAHLAEMDSLPETLYIGGVASRDFYSKAVVMEALKSEIYQMANQKTREIMTRPVTDDGLRLVQANGFRSVSGKVLKGEVFVLRLGTPKRRTASRVPRGKSQHPLPIVF